MKKVDSAIASNNAAGDGWFKIWDESFDEAAGKWCINKMVDNNGHLSVTVPIDIEGGYYLVRPELLALHAAQDSPPDPQFYVGCAQVYVDSTGSAKPATVTIPQDYVDISMPGMTFNIYSKPLALPYPMFGPAAYRSGGGQESPISPATPAASPASSASAVASLSISAYVKAANSTAPDAATSTDAAATDDAETDDSADEECNAAEGDDTESDSTDESAAGAANDTAGSTGTPTYDSPAATTATSPATSSVAVVPTKNQSSSSSGSGQTEGLKPDGCIMINANWCGFEVKSYTDENGCWSASADCWSQSKACFDQAPPTGAKNCDLWGNKCNHLDDTCNAKQFTGPPDAGKDLTPAFPDLTAMASRKLMALVKKHESHVMKRAFRARH